MSRMSISVDDRLIEEAGEALGTSSKVETIRAALSEAVRRRRLAQALDHQGQIELALDQATLERLRQEP